jgi:deltex-like protein
MRIGTSQTTGAKNQVVWGDIPHKTAFSGGFSRHGYPDETYFERLKDAIA